MQIKLLRYIEKKWRANSYAQEHCFWLKILSWPLMLLYISGAFFKRSFFRCPLFYTKVSNPLVVIGNIAIGGSGKSPLTMKCAEYFYQKGLSPHLVSRAYGAKFHGSFASYRAKQWDREGFFGDEVEMFVQRFPQLDVSIGKRRALLVQKIHRQNKQKIILLDDALQYWRLKNGFNIVMIHGELLFGNGHIFPYGPLRENPVSALKRANIVVIYHPVKEKSFYIAYLNGFGNQNPLFLAAAQTTGFYRLSDQKKIEPAELAAQKLVLVSGIAHPHYFAKSMTDLHVQLLKHFVFPDHYNFSNSDCQAILDFASLNSADWICLTEKDKMRWPRLDCDKVIYSHQEVIIEGEREFFQLIDDYVN